MYQIGSLVVYGIHGVCSVVQMETQVIDRKVVTYLVLEPVGQEGSKYMIPTNNMTAMAQLQPMLTPQELEEMLCSQEVRRGSWNRDENARKQSYRELIACGDRMKLMQMVHTLYRHKKSQLEAGKKVHMADDNFLRDAERILIGEISVIKDMSSDEAKLYLKNKLIER